MARNRHAPRDERSATGRCLVLFTKPGEPGRVKTRLVGELTAEQAAELHDAFVADAVERLRRGPYAFRIAWDLEEGEEAGAFDVPGFPQEGATLGERLYRGLLAAAADHERVAAIGSDHPDLPSTRLVEAFRALERGNDLVLGPADDGGYYLIGVARGALHSELFSDIPWSTSAVLDATLARAARLGLRVHLLPQAPDVDTPEDLRRLAGRLVADAGSCPRTRSLLAAWGRLGAPAES